MITTLAALILLQAGLADFPWRLGANAEILKKVDVVAVVTAVQERKREIRQELVPAGAGLPPSVPGNSVWVRVADVTGLAGKGIEKGEKLRMVAPISPSLTYLSPGSPSYSPPQDRIHLQGGQRYLLLAYRSKAKRLDFPAPFLGGGNNLNPADATWHVEMGDKTEVAAVMLFPTTEKEFPSEPKFEDILTGVVKTFNPKDDDSFRRGVEFLRHNGPTMEPLHRPGYPANPGILTTKDCAVTKAVKDILPKATAYQKTKLWQLLLEWRVQGSSYAYVAAMTNLANDASVYSEGSDDSMIDVVSSSFELGWSDAPKSGQWLNTILTSANDRIVCFLLVNTGPILNRNEQVTLAQRLLDRNPNIRLLVARNLSFQNKDATHRPWITDSPEEVAPKVQYWIDYYQVKPPGTN